MSLAARILTFGLYHKEKQAKKEGTQRRYQREQRERRHRDHVYRNSPRVWVKGVSILPPEVMK
jgi:hypothetical protein